MTTLKVPKGAISVVIYTAAHRIEATYHTHQDVSRLLDDLNGRQKDFIPLTNVKVANLQDETRIVFESDFIAFNKHSIVLFSENPKK